ncbi:hypothetical protein B0T13DRAFT_219212 [Neurospora crassa]|nr:hypothetical protein B0T13DRAFT_219212 [Neurospora crassa]
MVGRYDTAPKKTRKERQRRLNAAPEVRWCSLRRNVREKGPWRTYTYLCIHQTPPPVGFGRSLVPSALAQHDMGTGTPTLTMHWWATRGLTGFYRLSNGLFPPSSSFAFNHFFPHEFVSLETLDHLAPTTSTITDALHLLVPSWPRYLEGIRLLHCRCASTDKSPAMRALPPASSHVDKPGCCMAAPANIITNSPTRYWLHHRHNTTKFTMIWRHWRAVTPLCASTTHDFECRTTFCCRRKGVYVF